MSVSFIWRDHMSPGQFADLRTRLPRSSRSIVLVLLFALIFLAGSLKAQQPIGSDSTQSNSSSTSDDSGAAAPALGGRSSSAEDSGSAMLSGSNTPAASLSADVVIQTLQQNPDLLMQVKSQVADRLQQQGTDVQASDISDDMLYNEISTNASIRTGVATFLQSQNYLSPGDLQTTDEEESQDSSSLQQSGSPLSSGINAGAPGASGNPTTVEGGAQEQGRTASAMRQQGVLAKREHEETNASTDLPKVLHQPTPYNLRSMHDLYEQIPEQSAPLKRFGSEVFVNRGSSSMLRGSSSLNTPLDIPLGPDYVVAPGDALTISIWGSVTQNLTRVIDRSGQILLPDVGSLQIAGLTLQRAGSLIEGALKQQYRDVQASVTISRLHSVRVYVVGDVQRPGAYDISSLATPLSALYAAGGPTSVGSLRIARHYRGDQLIEEVDLYEFLLHGVQKGSARFESGDTLQVPPAGAQVAVSGAVKRPAIYELKPGESTLASVIGDAGGITAAASLNHITIERIDANRQRETVAFEAGNGQDIQAERAALEKFAVKDGDRIRIAPILPYSERVIYLQGHVVRPGRLPYVEGMQLSDVLRSYQDLLPEPAAHGELVRLVPPDLHAETIAFNVPDVLIGNANLPLQPFDTIRIFGRYEIDVPKVTIDGEVLRPGTYPMSKGMTAAQLVRMAGGFKRDALLDTADLTSYRVEDGNKADGVLSTVRIGAAVSGADPSADVLLNPGDILAIHQITGWNDIAESVTIEGQVKFPGSYGFQEGERLSSVLRRAGGMRDTAYPEGAVLVRQQVRELEERRPGQ
jgi:protein involved in polysaccharide export with SLBB domain